MSVTLEDVRDQIAHIDRVKTDFEVAHSNEDDLYEAVLRTIANGDRRSIAYLRLLAREALATKEIEFPRYCA